MIELVSRFAAEVEAALGNVLPVATLVELREVDQLPPAALGARLAGRPAGADLPGPACGSGSRRSGTAWPTSFFPARWSASGNIGTRRTWSTGWPGR